MDSAVKRRRYVVLVAEGTLERAHVQEAVDGRVGRKEMVPSNGRMLTCNKSSFAGIVREPPHPYYLVLQAVHSTTY